MVETFMLGGDFLVVMVMTVGGGGAGNRRDAV